MGRSRRRPVRPRSSLTDKLANLHLLLRVPSFARWPLQVHFFCQDVYKLWIRWSEGVDAETKTGIDAVLDLKKPLELPADEDAPPSTQLKEKKKNRKSVGQGGLEGIDVGYSKLATQLEKSLFLLADGEKNSCAICDEEIDTRMVLVLVCPEQECRAASHLNCLAQRFLHEGEEKSSMLPTSGKCPRCRSRLKWIDLVKELSLRLSGEAQVARLMKKPKTRTKKTSRRDKKIFSAVDENIIDDINNLDHDRSSSDDDSSTRSASEERLVDDWYYQQDDDDAMSVTSNASGVSSCFDAPSPTKKRGSAPNLGILVEDSEWDDAEVLD